jgi:hypothetical protein
MRTPAIFICIVLLSAAMQPLCGQDLNPSQWPHLSGYWKFQNASNREKATVGKDLTLVGSEQMVKGASFKDTGTRITIGSYYKCYHNISPNGGGDSVNRYTLMFDFKILDLKKWHTFFQTDTTNKNDGECFIRPLNSATPGTIGVGYTGYSKDTVIPNKWHRLMISVNLGHFYRYYLDGKLIHEGDTQDVDGRFALNPHFLLFADDNQEDDTIDVASVAVFDTCLSAADIAKIGPIDPCVLHPMSISLGRDTTICGDHTLVKNLGAGKFSYKWSTGDTASSLVLSMKKLGSGLKTIWVKKTDINQCTVSDTFLVGFYNKPNVNLGKDTGFCQGLKLKITAGSAVGNSFVWRKLPGAYIVSKINNYTVDSTGTYFVWMTNQYGCSNIDTIQVNVHPNPTKPILNTTKTEICHGDTAMVSGPGGFNTYLWSDGASTQAVSLTQSKTLSLIVWDHNGCESPASDSLHIDVHPLPATPELKAMPDTVICAGDSISLYTPDTHDTYIWSDGSGLTSRIIKHSDSFYLLVKNQFGCSSHVSNTLHLTVNERPQKPVIELSGSLNSCMGDSVALHSKDSATRYAWSNNDTVRTLSVKSSETFKLRTINSFQCQSDWSDSLALIFHTLPPKPDILSLGQDSLTCSIVAQRYQWIVDGNSGQDTFKSIKGIDKSAYMVKIGSEWCWSPVSGSLVFEKSSIQQTYVARLMFKVSPNPSEGQIKMQMRNMISTGLVAIRITDISSQIVLDLSTDTDKISKGLDLDLSHWAAGIYIVRVSTLEGVYYSRFVLR